MIEREIKFKGVAHEDVRFALRAADARQLSAAAREDNQLWDRSQELRTAGCVLRVRRVGELCILTFKGKASHQQGAKVREEHEVGVTAPETLDAILYALGYRKVFRYQKVREAWTLEGHEIVLDTTPLGEFVEIEGPQPEVLLQRLALSNAEPLQGSYPSLWQAHRQAHPEATADMIWPSTGPQLAEVKPR